MAQLYSGDPGLRAQFPSSSTNVRLLWKYSNSSPHWKFECDIAPPVTVLAKHGLRCLQVYIIIRCSGYPEGLTQELLTLEVG
jgi:hypothetical protein